MNSILYKIPSYADTQKTELEYSFRTKPNQCECNPTYTSRIAQYIPTNLSTTLHLIHVKNKKKHIVQYTGAIKKRKKT